MPRSRHKVDRRAIALLSVCHGCIDLANGAVPALLPFLIIERGYSYAETTSLILAVTIFSSVLQPLFGHLADSRQLSQLMPAGLGVAGVAIALVGLVEDHRLAFILICVVGIASAAFHPEAARYANYVSGTMRARGMSLFSVGGNAGFACGPILVTPLVLALGLGGTVWLLLPFALITVLLIVKLPYLASFAPAAPATPSRSSTQGQVAAGDSSVTDHTPSKSSDPDQAGDDRWGAFWLLAAVSGLRSTVHFGMQAFIPAYFIATFSTTVAAANAALTGLLICGALGTLVGGWVADRLGLKRIILVSLGILPPLIVAVLISGQAGAYILVCLIGFFTVATFAPTVVMGQQLLPSRIGVASGVTLGASIGVGGALAAALGPVADGAGLESAIVILALLPLPALMLTYLLPDGRPQWRKVEPA